MKHKTPTQQELIRSVRKPMPRPTMVERPDRGGGYKRPQGRQDFHED